MKTARKLNLLAAALVGFCALASSTIQAQDKPAFRGALTLAPNDATSPGGAGGGAPAENAAGSQEALAKAAQNPIANMISVPFQNNFNFGLGPKNVTQWNLDIQPVIPFSISEDWNVVTRTIIPLFDTPSTAPGVESASGLGDINPTAWLSPAKPGKLIWGVGPTMTFPTATDSQLGSGKYSAGPSVVGLTIHGHWVVGALANQQWSYAGWGHNNVSTFLVQPFVNYNLSHGWYLVSSPIITANWEADSSDQWTVPVGGGVGKIFKIGKQSFNAQLQAFNNVHTPNNGPDWQLRFQIQLLFPEKKTQK